jgi:uncharacterized protein (TIGR03067 family)
MRACAAVGLVVGLFLPAQVGTLRGDPGKETETDKIARLIQQLGDDAFRKREAASKELDAIGEPALVALRKAAASSDDAEIRRRAERISEAIAARVAEAGAKPELAKLQGVWAELSYNDEGKQVGVRCTITITGDEWVQKWVNGDGRAHVHSGILKILNAGETPLAVDWIHQRGSYVGSTTLTIVQVDGDTLKECWRQDGVRPTEFAAKEGFPHLVTYRRQKQ